MKSNTKFYLLPVFFLFFICNLNTSCEIDQLATSINEANDIIRQGIDKIVANSEDWQNIVTNDILPFVDKELTWVIEDLNTLLTKTVQEAQAHVACIADQADDRVVRGLHTILTDIDGMRRHDFVLPYVCSASPAIIDLKLPPSHRLNIQVSGFDFVDPKAVQLFLRKSDGTEVPVVQNRTSHTSNYLLQVDISDWDSTLGSYKHLVVRYNQLFLTEIPIYN